MPRTCPAALILLLGWGPPALAEDAPAPVLKIERKQELNFGLLVPGPGFGSFAIGPTGAPKAEGVSAGAGRPVHGVFLLTGPADKPFRVKFPDSVPATRRPGLPWVDLFQAAVAGRDLLFDGDGKAELRVGATLHLPPGAPQGQLALPPVELIVDCAGASVTATFQVKGRLVLPIVVEPQGGPMLFGKLVSPARDTQVLLHPDGRREVLEGGSRAILVGSAASRAGQFQVKGEPEERVSVLLPAEAELHGPEGVMKIVQFRSDVPPEGLLLHGGQATVRVGATLQLLAGQPPGHYTGYYTVVFDYQ